MNGHKNDAIIEIPFTNLSHEPIYFDNFHKSFRINFRSVPEAIWNWSSEKMENYREKFLKNQLRQKLVWQPPHQFCVF